MEHHTKLTICVEIDENDIIDKVLEGLPLSCISTFKHIGDTWWLGEFRVSCTSAPELAEGDFVDDLCPYFPTLLRLKNLHSADYELHIAVGSPAEEFWNLEDYSIALLAALGASITIKTAARINETHQSGGTLLN